MLHLDLAHAGAGIDIVGKGLPVREVRAVVEEGEDLVRVHGGQAAVRQGGRAAVAGIEEVFVVALAA